MLAETLVDTNTSTGTNQCNTPRLDAAHLDSKLLEAFLSEVTLRPSGLTIHVDTEEKPRLIFDKKISNVRVNSAWITFTAGNTTYRTKTISDRNKFYAWYQSPSPLPFSTIKGQENVFGPPDVTFIKAI